MNGNGVLVMTNSSNGEGIFRPLVEALLGETTFPFGWDGYTRYDKLPPLPKLKEHKRVTLTADQLNRLVGRYALAADIILIVTVENGRLFIRENDEEKQEYLAESPNDFYSITSTDECSFKPETGPCTGPRPSPRQPSSSAYRNSRTVACPRRPLVVS